MSKSEIDYIDADEAWGQKIAELWSEKAARHMHFIDGFSMIALHDQQPIGLISTYWKTLYPPLSHVIEGYIDILEVVEGFRRQGIATHLINLTAERARDYGATQLRSWSSEDKTEAIPMWKALGFGLHPAITYPQDQEIKGVFVTKVLT